jgi:hypothetical protein
MLYMTLKWQGPFLLLNFDFSRVPARPGVYVFTEYAGPLRPNPPLPPETDPGYQALIGQLRTTPCLLYVGKATSLASRLLGYRFRPYLEIQRRPKGTPPRHAADRHKGRALLHAHQFFDGRTYLSWAETSTAAEARTTEDALIKELRPVLNTVGI